MRYVLQLLILVAAIDISTARALDRIRLAQAVPGQMSNPRAGPASPADPDPVALSAGIHGLRGHLVDTQAMNCQNACVAVGPTTGTLKSRCRFGLHPQLHHPTARLQTGVQQAAAVNCMSRTFLTFGDIAGKLHILRIECTRCQRKGRHTVAKLVAQYGRRRCRRTRDRTPACGRQDPGNPAQGQSQSPTQL